MTPDDYGTPELFQLGPSQVSDSRDLEKTRPQRPVAWGNCPCCTNTRVGLIRVHQHLAWKQHYVTTWAGVAMPCRASSIHVCDLPEREPYVTPLAGPAQCAHVANDAVTGRREGA